MVVLPHAGKAGAAQTCRRSNVELLHRVFGGMVYFDGLFGPSTAATNDRGVSIAGGGLFLSTEKRGVLILNAVQLGWKSFRTDSEFNIERHSSTSNHVLVG